MTSDNLTILIEAERIQKRVRELGAGISRDYQGTTPHLIGILKGAWVFLADLVRSLEVDVTVDFLGISSYTAGAQSSGEVKITKDLDVSIEGRDVLIVEDILDTGLTFQYLQNILAQHRPHSLRLVTLLDKSSRRLVPLKADYVGFEIPDHFVVGYGLDFDQQYRRLADICYFKTPPGK